MPRINLTIEFDREGGAKRLANKLSPTRLSRTEAQATKAAVEQAKKIVEEEYKSSPEQRTWWTLETYGQGKAPGNTPVRHTYSGGPLTRTGQLANSVESRRVHSSPPAYTVYIRRGSHDQGDPADANKALGMIADQMETALDVQIPVTVRMLAYIHALKDGIAGTRVSGRAAAGEVSGTADQKVTVMIIRRVSRDVWARAHARLGEITVPYVAVWQDYFTDDGK